ncbi:MAG TPA: flippase [Candidatus Paceibacterota bacterium]|nr:flippase [Candidatus Paceibacterota bacterium]
MEGFIRYFKNTGWLLSQRLFGMVIGFFVTAIVVRYLGPVNNGILNYAISFVGLFGFLASLGLDQVIYRDLIKYPERENEFLGTSIILRLAAGFLAMLLAISFGRIFNSDQTIFYTMAIVSLAFVFQAFSIIIYSFQAKVESHLPSIATMIVVVILAILKLLVVYYHKGVFYFGAIYTLEPFLYAVFFIFFYQKYYSSPLRWNFNKNLAREIVIEAFPLMLSVVFTTIYSRIDQVLLNYMIDVKAVGIYDPAVRLSELWYFIPAILTGSLFPSIINAYQTDEKLYAKRLIRLTLLLMALSASAGIFVTILAHFLMNLVFGPAFVTGYRVLQLYVWSGLGVGIGFVINQFLITEKMVRYVLYSSIIGMLLNVILNLLLIPSHGINGSALATLISYILGPLSVMLFPRVRKRVAVLFRIAQL